MTIWGISARSHDAAIAVYDYKTNDIVYASHSERYSRIKNDKDLHPDQIARAFEYGEPSYVFFYENTTRKKQRQWQAGQYKLLLKQSPQHYLKQFGVTVPVTMIDHHHSHAAYGFCSDPYLRNDQDILVIDSIGEFETISVWHGRDRKLNKVWSQNYPHSVGLWYSAMTHRLGLKPQEHEYILMGMAALGDPSRYYQIIRDDFFKQLPGIDGPGTYFKHNLHRGCMWWRPEINSVQDYVDIAAAVQQIYEEIFVGLLTWMRHRSDCKTVTIVGGCALNCVANTLAFNFYDHVWVPPNPGDAGSSVGAIAAGLNVRLPMSHAYYGTNINGEYPIEDILDDLERKGKSAVASGPAEFGPRALGNRSILADPRILDIKDQINQIKKREEFRPFAPMILKEHLPQYFKIPRQDFEAPFMQFAIPCLQPHKFPGIVHVDGTSRIQTVDESNGPVYELLTRWYDRTGCPMLLNTSLNIKGQPIVNTRPDADRFETAYAVKVFS